MIRKLVFFFSLFALVLGMPMLRAQVPVSASHVADAFEHPLASAKLCFAPVDATGAATGFRVGSVQVVPGAVCGLVSSGALQAGLSVAPSPSGIYYHIWAANRTTNATIRDYGMTPITGSGWTLDTFDPNLAIVPVPTISVGTVTTLAPGSGAYCAISGSSPYQLNCGIPAGYNGAGFIQGLTGDGTGNVAVQKQLTASTVAATGPVSASNLSALGHASADLSLNGGVLSGPLNGPQVNSEQIAGQGTNTTIKQTVTTASYLNSLRVPTSFSAGEMDYLGAALSNSLLDTSTYNSDALAVPPTDLRQLDQDVSAMQKWNLPMLEAEATGGDTSTISKCITTGGPCPIVMVGHSIAENDNAIGPDDSGLQSIADALNRKFPGVFTFLNYSLSGNTVENLIDPTYKCQISGTNTYYRAPTGNWYGTGYNFTVGPPFLQWPVGCAIGYTWEQMVASTNPVAVIYDYAANESSAGTYQYATDLQTAITWAKALPTNPTVVLITDFAPNYSIETTASPALQEALNQTTRDIAKQNNLLLVDAARNYWVWRAGVDPVQKHGQFEGAFGSFTSNSYPAGWLAAPSFSGTLPSLINGGSVAAYLNIVNGTNPLVIERNRVAWDFTINATFTVGAVGGTAILGYRNDPTTGAGYYFEATSTSSTAFTVTLWWAPSGLGSGGTALWTGSCTGAALGFNLQVRTNGAYQDIWCGVAGTPAHTIGASLFADFHKITPGTVVMGFTSTAGSIGNEYVEYRNPTGWVTPQAATIALVGGISDFYHDINSYGGNNDHHPGAVGMDTIYLSAWAPVLAAIERDGKIAYVQAHSSSLTLTNALASPTSKTFNGSAPISQTVIDPSQTGAQTMQGPLGWGAGASIASSSKVMQNCGSFSTSGTSHTLACSWVTASSTCSVQPANSAATTLTGIYYTAAAGTVTAYYGGTTGGYLAVACSIN